jgi:hypothetical protein
LIGPDDGAGLPDGLFSNQNSQFGKILEGLAMENLGIFYDHLVYFRPIGSILWSFGIFVVIWYISPHFGILYQDKSGNPATDCVPFFFLPSRTALYIIIKCRLSVTDNCKPSLNQELKSFKTTTATKSRFF